VARTSSKEELVSSASTSGKSSGKTIIAIVFFVEQAHSLPSFMGKITHPYARAHATRPLHGAAALVAAIVCFVAAFFVNRSNKAVSDGSRDPDAVDARR